jgi:stearoyl-CoA 9-desaturase NADPH oxidoreductase
MFAVATPRVHELGRNFRRVSGMLRSRVARRVAPRLDRALVRVSTNVPILEAILEKVDPTLSLHAVRARVIRIVDETPDTKTYWLQPNARFETFRPGSYVSVRVRIDGQIVERSYSLSCAPRPDGLISITVTRVAEGRVSNWLADSLRPGQVVELSQANGQFVLPRELPPKLLMLSAGSGITPVMSMLRQLIADRAACQIVFVHFARSPRNIIFRDELARIADAHDNVRIVLCVESAGSEWLGARGRVCEQLLLDAAEDFRSLDTFMCGPAGFMQAVMQILERGGGDLSKLRYERFNAALDVSQFLKHAQLLRFVRSGTERIATSPGTILEEAERAGVPINSGCRAGNCGTCRCRKTRGVVVDITTGRESGAGEEFIYPCVSVARGTVEIDL